MQVQSMNQFFADETSMRFICNIFTQCKITLMFNSCCFWTFWTNLFLRIFHVVFCRSGAAWRAGWTTSRPSSAVAWRSCGSWWSTAATRATPRYRTTTAECSSSANGSTPRPMKVSSLLRLATDLVLHPMKASLTSTHAYIWSGDNIGTHCRICRLFLWRWVKK